MNHVARQTFISFFHKTQIKPDIPCTQHPRKLSLASPEIITQLTHAVAESTHKKKHQHANPHHRHPILSYPILLPQASTKKTPHIPSFTPKTPHLDEPSYLHTYTAAKSPILHNPKRSNLAPLTPHPKKPPKNKHKKKKKKKKKKTQGRATSLRHIHTNEASKQTSTG